MPANLVIDLVRHMKARNRDKWAREDGERPLSRLGQRQAEMHAAAMAQGDPIVAVYSSPALRCRQTIDPLARQLGLDVGIEPLLAESGSFYLPLGAENPLIEMLQAEQPSGGRVVVCSHGDTIPAFLASLDTEAETAVAGLLQGFGGWYRVRFSGDQARIEHFDVPEGFPRD